METVTRISRATSETMGGLLSGLFDDIQRLIRQEATLIRTEFRYRVQRLVLATAATAVGFVWLSIGLVYLLHEEALLSFWQSFGAIGLMLVMVGGSLFLTRLKKRNRT